MRLGSAKDEEGKQLPEHRCPETNDAIDAVYRWGDAAMDALHVLCSIVDVVSDLLVAVEFYEKGRMGFFYLVLSSLMLSTVLYAICGVLEDVPTLLHRVPWCRRHMKFTPIYSPIAECYAFGTPLHRWLVGVCILPVAQLVPLLCLAQSRVDMFRDPSGLRTHLRKEKNWFAVYGVRDQDGPNPAAGSATAPMRDRFGGSLMRRLDPLADRMSCVLADGALEETKAIREAQARFELHLRAHKLFYMEVVVESIPQAVVQFLAVTMYNDVTHLQLLSIGLSVLSIATKVDIIPNVGSISASMMQFRRAVCLHDLFNFFFIFASLVAQDENKGYPLLPVLLPNGPRGSALGMLWCVKEALLLALVLAYAVLFAGCIAYDNVNRIGWRRCWRACVKQTAVKLDTALLLVLFSVCTVAALPIVLLFLDMFKLSALLLLLMAMEGQHDKGSRCLILSHLERAETGREWHHRLHACVSTAGQARSGPLPSFWQDARKQFLELCDPLPQQTAEVVGADGLVPLDVTTPREGWWVHLNASAPLWVLLCAANAVGTSVAHEVRKTTWLWKRPAVGTAPPNVAYYPAVPVVGVPLLACLVSITLGVAFPILHAYHFLDRWNGLQWMCASGIFLSSAVMLWPPLLLYNLRVAAMVVALRCFVGRVDPQVILMSVLNYLQQRCSGAALLGTILYDPLVNPEVPPVDHALLPEDLVAVIGSLMSPLHMVGTDRTNIDACLLGRR